MFWFVIFFVVLLTVGASVFIGLTLQKRPRPPSQRRQVDMAKASGAFSHRKSNRP